MRFGPSSGFQMDFQVSENPNLFKLCVQGSCARASLQITRLLGSSLRPSRLFSFWWGRPLFPPEVNLGRYQAPLHVAQRTLCHFAAKGYLMGAACLNMGLSLSSSAKASASTAAASSSSSSSAQGGAVEDPAVLPEKTLQQLSVQPWDASASNSLHKAAHVFTSLENYWLQRLVVRSLLPTAEFHSKCLDSSAGRAETSWVNVPLVSPPALLQRPPPPSGRSLLLPLGPEGAKPKKGICVA